MEDKIVKLTDGERTVCEVWTRVMGYYRPISAFNNGKRSEYGERKCFKETQGECESCESDSPNLDCVD
ncbi:MAG: anaerobic ribonucleoside-triphosphate reductase [Holosporales bacterium]|jgi:hypothetical protein|nr:anaerobic ribonucleoside-triphosphate reductase [Holosporales bacterium]